MSSGPARPFVSVKFTPPGRTYSFLLPEFDLDGAGHRGPHVPPIHGEQVVVETADGPALATVTRSVPAGAGHRSPAADSPARFVRRASQEDVIARLKHEQREKDAHRVCLLKIRERGLEMKLTRVEQLFDGSRLIFYYTAEGRVDFRELVRDLAAHFRTRIEMRQIGVRDEARMLGGYGSCGRPLCCTTWLQSFEPVSIKMAKQQNLSLNPSRLSGMCGRLKCCLRYELPNAKGVVHGGCGEEGGCGSCDNPTGPSGGCGSCGSGGCGSCGT
jgi:cell fate regulator YaaT (PSP1 superfamily)